MAGPRTPLLYKNVARIDYSRCVRCGRCASACPLHAISWRPKSYPRVDRRLCIGCTICVNACPVSAIGIGKTVSLLPVALVVAVTLAAVGAAFLWSYQPLQPEAASAPSVVEAGWAELPSLGTPTGGGEVNMSYYMALEEEAGTEGG